MAFEVKLLPSASIDLESALAYYRVINTKLSQRFLKSFLELEILLSENPFFEIRYDFARTTQLKQFPYIVHFATHEVPVFGKRAKFNFTDRLKTPWI
jgi:hypothetical protein